MIAVMPFLIPMLVLAAPLPGSQPTAATTPAIQRAADLESLDALERELKLEGEALARFRAKADAERLTLSAWTETEKGREFSALARERAAASRAKDLEKAKELWERMRPISAERAKLRNELRRDVLATLTPEQVRQWAGYVLFAWVESDLNRIALTDEQRKQLRSIADAQVAKDFDPAKVADDPFLQDLHRLRPRVVADARQRVLTPEQLEKLRAKRVPGLTTRPGKAAPVEKESIEKE
jgi:Spy/CpxP family protein refolding chaperone